MIGFRPYLLSLLIFFSACSKITEAPLEKKSIIDSICANPDLSTYCTLLSITGELNKRIDLESFRRADCDSTLTIFALTNYALDSYVDFFPQWNTFADVPLDTQTMILQHHIFDGSKIIFSDTADANNCEIDIIFGNSQPTVMRDGGQWIWARSPAHIDTIAALSFTTGIFARFNINSSAYVQNGDTIVYVLDRVLGPFSY